MWRQVWPEVRGRVFESHQTARGVSCAGVRRHPSHHADKPRRKREVKVLGNPSVLKISVLGALRNEDVYDTGYRYRNGTCTGAGTGAGKNYKAVGY